MARAHWTDDDCQLVLDEDWDAIQADHARAQAGKGRQAVPCRNCHAPAGQPCRNHRGQREATCPERGTPAPPPPPAPARGLFDHL
jgi:hypothetical protein